MHGVCLVEDSVELCFESVYEGEIVQCFERGRLISYQQQGRAEFYSHRNNDKR